MVSRDATAYQLGAGLGNGEWAVASLGLLILDEGALPGGGVYNTLASAVAAANLANVAEIFVNSNVTVTSGNYDLSGLRLYARVSYPSVNFTGTAKLTGLPEEMDYLTINLASSSYHMDITGNLYIVLRNGARFSNSLADRIKVTAAGYLTIEAYDSYAPAGIGLFDIRGGIDINGYVGTIIPGGTGSGTSLFDPNSLYGQNNYELTFDGITSVTLVDGHTRDFPYNDALIGDTITIGGAGANNGTFTITGGDAATRTIIYDNASGVTASVIEGSWSTNAVLGYAGIYLNDRSSSTYDIDTSNLFLEVFTSSPLAGRGLESGVGPLNVTTPNKTVYPYNVGVPVTVNILEAGTYTDRLHTFIYVVDREGAAATNNITITPVAGTINGQASYVISENFGSVMLVPGNDSEWLIESAHPAAGGTDANAVHKNVAGEIATVTLKGTPVSGDLLLIEDSADSNNKKHVTVGSLPSGGGATPVLVLDTGGVAAGNVYTTLSSVLAAAAAISGPKIISIVDAFLSVSSGAYNFADCTLKSPFGGVSLSFQTSATISELPKELINVTISDSKNAGNLVSLAKDTNIIFRGTAGIESQSRSGSSFTIRLNGFRLNLYLNDSSSLWVGGSSGGYAYVGNSGEVRIYVSTSRAPINTLTTQWFINGTTDLYIYGHSATIPKASSFISTTGTKYHYLENNSLSKEYTLPTLSSNQNNYTFDGIADGAVFRIAATTPVSITGINNLLSGLPIVDYTNQPRVFVNVGSFPISFPSQSTASSASNRFLLSDPISNDLVLNSRESMIMIRDFTSDRWRLIKEGTQRYAYTVNSTTMTAAQNDWVPVLAQDFYGDIVFLAGSGAPRVLTGIVPSITQRFVFVNTGDNTISITHQDTNSAAENRVICPGGTTIVLSQDDNVNLIYDKVALRWRVI